MQLLPGTPVDQTNPATDDPAPSLHPHRARQELPRYYGPVRQRVPRRYSVLTGSARLGHSLSPSSPGRQYRDAPSHVPCESPDQAHVAYMPDTAWPISGHPPDSSRAKSKHPVLISPLRYDTSPATPPARGCAPSSWSPPDASHDAFSTSLTTTVFSQRSRWRFEASPRRTAPKGQLLHLSHSIASRSFAYIDGSSLRSWRTDFRR